MKPPHTARLAIFVFTLAITADADKPKTVQGVIEGPRGALLADVDVSLVSKAGAQPLATHSADQARPCASGGMGRGCFQCSESRELRQLYRRYDIALFRPGERLTAFAPASDISTIHLLKR